MELEHLSVPFVVLGSCSKIWDTISVEVPVLFIINLTLDSNKISSFEQNFSSFVVSVFTLYRGINRNKDIGLIRLHIFFLFPSFSI